MKINGQRNLWLITIILHRLLFKLIKVKMMNYYKKIIKNKIFNRKKDKNHLLYLKIKQDNKLGIGWIKIKYLALDFILIRKNKYKLKINKKDPSVINNHLQMDKMIIKNLKKLLLLLLVKKNKKIINKKINLIRRKNKECSICLSEMIEIDLDYKNIL